jgi:hypothetical protein
MAYTDKAEQTLANVGMKPIPQAVAKLSTGATMKAYKEFMTLGTLSEGIENLSEALNKLSVSRPASPARPKTLPTTGTGGKYSPAAPKKPAAGKKTNAGKNPGSS